MINYKVRPLIESLNTAHLGHDKLQSKAPDESLSTAYLGHDKLYNVRPLIESLNTAFRDIYYPTCELSVDGIQGSLRFQAVFATETKWGIKLWVLCEAKSGYTLNFSVYCGKESTTTNAQPLGSRIVFELMEPYYMKWHQLFMDNFYSSPQLFKELLMHVAQFGAIGEVFLQIIHPLPIL